MTRWAQGETVTVRHVWGGQVRFAHPAIVVADEPDQLALFEPVGAVRRWSAFDFETGEMPSPVERSRYFTDALIR